jgi:hypothetical protein
MACENSELLYWVVGTLKYYVRVGSDPEQEFTEAIDKTLCARGRDGAVERVKKSFFGAKEKEIEGTYIGQCIPRIWVGRGSWQSDLCVRIVNV